MASLAPLISVACGEAAPEVEVSVAVRPVDQGMADIDKDNGEERSLAQAKELLARTWSPVQRGQDPALADSAAAAAAADAGARGSIKIETEPPQSEEAFNRLVEQLRRASIDELAVPVHNLAHASPEVWPQVRDELLAERQGSKSQFSRILKLIGGDVPNRYGHFALSWKQAHGFRVKLSKDWFADLQTIPTGQISGPMRKVYRDALLTVALAQASARIGKQSPQLAGEVVSTLLDLAYLTGGTFRDEVGRAIVSMGDEAVPHLVLASVEPARAQKDHPDRLRARYATHNLDRLDRLSPAAALAANSREPRRLAELLSAYGEAKPGDAASPLLDYVDHDDLKVREAAQRSFRAYVEGPPPRMRVKMVRTMGGKVVRRQAQLSYRALATLAIRERVGERLPTALENEPECEVRREDGSYDQHCLDQPARLTALLLSHLDKQRTQTHRAELKGALALADTNAAQAEQALDTLLLDGWPEDPALTELRASAVDFYRARAQDPSLARDPLARATRLRKAASLAAEQDATMLRALALRDEARAEGLTPDGRRMLLAKATALGADPAASSSPAASEAAEPATSSGPVKRLAWSLLLSVIALLSLSWLGSRRHASNGDHDKLVGSR